MHGLHVVKKVFPDFKITYCRISITSCITKSITIVLSKLDWHLSESCSYWFDRLFCFKLRLVFRWYSEENLIQECALSITNVSEDINVLSNIFLSLIILDIILKSIHQSKSWLKEVQVFLTVINILFILFVIFKLLNKKLFGKIFGSINFVLSYARFEAILLFSLILRPSLG